MASITILNKHHTSRKDAIYIGRGSPLGNPFHVNQYGRIGAINLFEEWLHKQIEEENPAVIDELNKIADRAKDGDCKLLCFCAPRRCHGDIIKKVVLDEIRKCEA